MWRNNIEPEPCGSQCLIVNMEVYFILGQWGLVHWRGKRGVWSESGSTLDVDSGFLLFILNLCWEMALELSSEVTIGVVIML